jgi:excisionase family DNA binding protein
MRPDARDLITKDEAANLIGFSARGLDKLIQSGRFPQPFRFSARKVRFDRDEVLAWREGRRQAG